jgi:hypothetical protein
MAAVERSPPFSCAHNTVASIANTRDNAGYGMSAISSFPDPIRRYLREFVARSRWVRL